MKKVPFAGIQWETFLFILLVPHSVSVAVGAVAGWKKEEPLRRWDLVSRSQSIREKRERIGVDRAEDNTEGWPHLGRASF